MRIVFTICSVNYLASAKTLRQSVTKHASDCKFVYIIADKIEGRIKEDFFEGDEFIEVAALGIPELEQMINTYNLTEFNTSIKPFALTYLHKKYNTTKFVYLDPDIILFNKIDHIWEQLDTNDFIVTPHILHPILRDDFYSNQVGALNTGIFNLGFIAINFNSHSASIIEWWRHHMVNHGHCNSVTGEFYDQKIMNLLPVFSDKVLILKDAGHNVAGWNIHERKITVKKNSYFVNETPLIFYHYSGFVGDATKGLISKYNKFKVENGSALSEILDLYKNGLLSNGHEKLMSLKCFYKLKPDIHKAKRFAVFSHKISKLFK